jgi:hypothetical protein
MHGFENSVEKRLHQEQEIRVPNGQSIKKTHIFAEQKKLKN